MAGRSSTARWPRWRATFAVTLALALLGVAPRAQAWNAHGHMLIALLAYDALSPAQRAAFGQLLIAHPRYREDIASALPPGLDAAAAQRWLFAYAATWPDVVGRDSSYAHGTWHYVNLPLSRRGTELISCRRARLDFPASVRRIARIDAERRARGEPGIPAGDSVLVALQRNRATLADARAPAAQRALALSWVLHLVGDVHQPLHGVALFDQGRFRTGDRGGNDILIGERSLHRVWDEALGEDTRLEALDAALDRLRMGKPAPVEYQARRVLDVDTWVNEDCELARSDVYVPDVLAAVQRFEARPAPQAAAAPAGAPPDKPQLSPPPEYFQRMGTVARSRALRAGVRLGLLLEQIPLPPPASASPPGASAH